MCLTLCVPLTSPPFWFTSLPAVLGSSMEFSLGPGGSILQIRISTLVILAAIAYNLGFFEQEKKGFFGYLRDLGGTVADVWRFAWEVLGEVHSQR